ncbi:PREDICTED: probable tRNA (guanine(26)-N(2))-dimethyltransferase [Nicrophorus vespilloides]|uniref:tRNA (guanine(26)-N(2))-dimethyltransferase n=1 Tax=Nicrophorus vespilloides TaxID=110193 RepID=A0ABM1NFE8_NICVS|nr:PREDICTED: probable tRNA (guanine(26)-N(2))-dimethyltransferase [Nicrophorus vespilloides]
MRYATNFTVIMCHMWWVRNITSKINRILMRMEVAAEKNVKVIEEGSAKIKTAGNVFYNPVQEFNRDLSVLVLQTFSKTFERSNLSILEALSATGLRSIRYAKEIEAVEKIVANDISIKAVQDIKVNIDENGVSDIVQANQSDATMFMYENRRKQFDAIDLDPYGCPSIFLDGAVQAVKDGGLLLVTATDMAVLAGNSPETCYAKYGSVSLKTRSCHEMALRILLQSIESHANRYGRYIQPLLSISADFYVRVFVRVFSGAQKCKYTTSKLSMVYHCTGCDSTNLQPLGILKKNDKKNNHQVKFALPTGPFTASVCLNCKHPLHMGGPIWSAPLHDKEFIRNLLDGASDKLGTFERIWGVLNVIGEELEDSPLYYTLEKLAGTLHCETPPLLAIRSAIMNAGYRVSATHMHKTSIKTDAPSNVVWDIMRCWCKDHPVSEKRQFEGSPAKNILSVEPNIKADFTILPDANPASRKNGYLRFQMNPQTHWGPGTRATAMVGEEKINKSKRNQGKRKREESVESTK